MTPDESESYRDPAKDKTMSAQYVREHYDVPAKRGMRVLAIGRSGTIVGFRGQYLRVRFDDTKRIETVHPTWRVHYPPDGM